MKLPSCTIDRIHRAPMGEHRPKCQGMLGDYNLLGPGDYTCLPMRGGRIISVLNSQQCLSQIEDILWDWGWPCVSECGIYNLKCFFLANARCFTLVFFSPFYSTLVYTSFTTAFTPFVVPGFFLWSVVDCLSLSEFFFAFGKERSIQAASCLRPLPCGVLYRPTTLSAALPTGPPLRHSHRPWRF